MPPPDDTEVGALERTRERLYAPQETPLPERAPLARASRLLPRAWQGARPILTKPVAPHHMKLASLFFIGALSFFGVALAVAGYLLYIGGNNVSVNNITLAVQGPSTIAGGDTVPLTIAITNRNPVEIDDVTLEADFPPGTRSATDVLSPLTTYSENIGTIKSGETITRSVNAVVFGSSGTTLEIPFSLSYGTKGSSATFVKKSSYPIDISSTPLSISADTIAETVAGKPLSITLQVRSNATVPIDKVVVEGTFPFGFTLTSSSVPAAGSDIALGTLAPGESRTVTLTGTLDGQDGEQRVFHFAVGTAATTGSGLAVSYMSQDASVTIAAPFIETTLTLNGLPLASATLLPGTEQSVVLSYTNTLSTSVTDATVSIALSGTAVDYSTVRTSGGFYNSGDHTIIFDKGTDSSLASLAPGTPGVGSFNFRTVPAASFGRAPSVTFAISVSGTRVGQSNVPEIVSASRTETIKAVTAVELSAGTLHASGPFANSGPIPPKVEQATTYAVEWKVANGGSAVAGGVVAATLPSYVDYTGKTSGQGSISYDSKSRTVTWSVGDLAQGAASEAAFQVSFTPSTSQRNEEPELTSDASFSGYDRFAGVTVRSTADAVTTETFGDPDYKPADATVE